MVDNDKPVPPVEISGGLARPLLTPEDMLAFQDWQRLTKDEKAALIWMAEHHPFIVQIVNSWRWLSQTVRGVIALGALAGAVYGILMLYSLWSDK